MIDYLREPEAIYRKSFETIAALDAVRAAPIPLQPLVTRLVHACGMPDIVPDLRSGGDIALAVPDALSSSADIYCDVETVRYGIMRRLLPAETAIHCRISAPDTDTHAKANRMTRAAAQIDLWADRLTGQIVVIGNAPTALFRLLEAIDDGLCRPAAILAFPVGFVGAAEAKAELAANPRGIPFVTLLGQRGGAGLAQAAVNALAGGLSR